MDSSNWKLRNPDNIDPQAVARIACALKSLSAYTAMTLEEDSEAGELHKILADGLAAIEEIFE